LLLTILVPEQQNYVQNKLARAVSQLSRRARTQQLAQDQAQVEGAYMNQLSLQNVVPSAWAQNDDLVLGFVARFDNALMSAGIKPEAHIYSAGGHGFGMKKQGTTSDHWIDEFYWWLEAQGFTKPVQSK